MEEASNVTDRTAIHSVPKCGMLLRNNGYLLGSAKGPAAEVSLVQFISQEYPT